MHKYPRVWRYKVSTAGNRHAYGVRVDGPCDTGVQIDHFGNVLHRFYQLNERHFEDDDDKEEMFDCVFPGEFIRREQIIFLKHIAKDLAEENRKLRELCDA